MSSATEPIMRTARQAHVCWWCGETIKAGAQYARWVWFDCGTALTVKAHPECSEAWRDIPPDDPDGVPFAQFSRGCTCEHGRCCCGAATGVIRT